MRSVVNAILGKVRGKASRLDTATRLAMEADFGDRREAKLPGPRPWRGRDNGHLRQIGWASADILIREFVDEDNPDAAGLV